jgi:O-antigen/teichoic acid export membrane protein
LKKEFLINVILLISINFLVKLSYLFLIEVNVQNAIGPAEYGLFLAFFNLTYLFHFINDPGIHAYNITHIAAGENEQSGLKLAKNLPLILGTKFVFAFIYLIIIAVVAFVLRYDQVLFPLILLVGFNHILSSIFLYLRSNFSAIGLYRVESFLSSLDKLLMLFFIGYFLLSKQISLFHFIFGQTLAFVVAILVSIILLRRRSRFTFPKFSWTFTVDLLKKSMPFAIILLLMASYNRMDGVMLERILPEGPYQAGVYAASFRYMEAANMVVYLIAGLLLPMFASSKEHNVVIQLTDLGIRIIAVIAVTVAVNIIIFRSFWMSIYTVEDGQYNTLIVYHMLSFVCIAISYVYGTLITAKARLKMFNLLLLSGVIINFTLNIYLIPRSYSIGAAQATFITQMIMTIGQFALARKYYRVAIDTVLIFRIFGYVLLLVLLLLGVKVWAAYPAIVNVIIGVLFSLIFAFLTGVLRKDMIFALFELKGQRDISKVE